MLAQYYIDNKAYQNAADILKRTMCDFIKIHGNNCAHPIKRYYEISADLRINNKKYQQAIGYLNEIPLQKVAHEHECIKI